MDIQAIQDLRPDVIEALRELKPRFKLCGPLKILVVVDGSIGLGSGFGIGAVVSLLDSTARGWVDFRVTTAHRSSTTFTDALLNQYHQLWLFGIDGGAGSLSAPERTALQKWMDQRQGGVFATGDHADLGAALCRQVPRVGTMRRWTNAQGVPPRNPEGRIDTNRPQNATQGPPGYAVIPDAAQSDAVPQPIEWVPVMRSGGLFGWHAPHPVLCHPTHGPINVMPDHPHEGMCFDTAPGNFQVDVSSATEYPTKAGVRPLPQVIAYGTTLADPPYWHEKRAFHPGVPMPAKRFPMISVYDGQRIGLGRVVVDSTWHHWMGMNIDALTSAAAATGATTEAVSNWAKIREYYINIAVWLATAQQRRCMARFYLSASHFQYEGLEEFRRDATTVELGAALARYLHKRMGPCWVRAWVLDLTLELNPKLHEMLRLDYLVDVLPPKQVPKPGPVCLSCPPWDVVEAHVLGGIVSASMKVTKPVMALFEAQKKPVFAISEKDEEAMILKGAAAGLAELEKAINLDLKLMKPMLTALKAVRG
ncbi:hypothetical protein [Hydrogenophaga sp.]|uniref:hypothetical protein n=1 Tax=Hydrogenophaga sp. TaxID=1904254 RepID=UPI00260C31B1|nr:hypothetical protein [Hydrogenophaga sp.]MDM7950603.1 hypothetical protein [Hydrogenophaga sp.]